MVAGRMWGALRVQSRVTGRRVGIEAVPPTFLCPVLHQVRRPPQRVEASNRASTSYATSHSLAEEESDHNERLLREGARFKLVEKAEDQSFSMSSVKGKAPARHGDGSGYRELSAAQLSQAALQSTLLARTAVLDIIKQPSDFPFSKDDELALDQARAIYMTSCANVPAFLDTLLPELAKAYIHIGHDRGAIHVMRLQHEAYVELARSISLEDWRSTLVYAYSHDRFDTTAALIRSSKSSSTPLADWAAFAQLDSQLRSLDESVEGYTIESDADRFWTAYDIDGRHASREMFDALTKSQLRRGRADLLTETLKARLRHGHRADEKLWWQLLALHPKGRRPAILRGLPEMLGDSAPKMLERMLRSLSRRKDVRRTLLLFRLFGIDANLSRSTTLTWRPTLSSFTSMTHMLIALRASDAALRFVRLAARFYNHSDEASQAYSRIWKQLAVSLTVEGRAEEALAISFRFLDIESSKAAIVSNAEQQIDKDFSDLPIALRPRSYTAAIDVCSYLADPAQAVRACRLFLSLMRERGVAIDGKTRLALVNVFARVFDNADWRQMAQALDKVALKAEEESAGSVSELKLFIEDMRRHGVMDRFALKTRFYQAQTPEDVRENLRWMTSQQNVAQSFSPHADNPLFNKDRNDNAGEENGEAGSLLFGSSMEPDPALHLREKLTSTGYALRLRVFAIVRGDHASASIIYRRMLSSGTKATSHHIAPIIEGLVLAGRLRDAKAVRDGARKTIDDLDGSMRIATAIVRGHARAGDWTAVRDEINSMRLRGVEPDITTWAAVGLARRAEMSSGKARPDDDFERAALSTQSDLNAAKEKMMNVLESDSFRTTDTEAKDLEALALHRGKPNVGIVTSVYKTLFNSRRFLQACQYMDRALDTGMVTDGRQRNMLRSNHTYLKGAARQSGVVIPGFVEADELTVEQDVRRPATHEARRQLNARHRRKRAYWTMTLKLCASNRHRASALHPKNVEMRKNERFARRAMLDLIFKTFGPQTAERVENVVREGDEGVGK